VSAMTPDGQELWTTQTSFSEANDLVVMPDGGVALLASKFVIGMGRQLQMFTSLGEPSWLAAAGMDGVLAVASDGRVALAGSDAIHFVDAEGNYLFSAAPPAVEELLGLRFFADDARLALVGSLGSALEPTAARDAAFGMVEVGGAGWVSAYADSRVSCDAQPTGVSDEVFRDIVVMPGGGFLLTGVEKRIGAGWEPLPSTHSLVAQLDADAQLMRVDRAAWPGVPRSPVIAVDGSAVVLINHSTSPDSYQVRKYLP
jgi:hypothetical protein